METKVAAVSMRGVTKTFGAVIANEDVDLDIYKGEILALLGENGSGKTTLMNMLSGIYFPDQGQIMINGQNVVIASPKDALNLGIGMVHQHFKLVDVLSATENIILGLEGKLNIKEAAKKILALVPQDWIKRIPFFVRGHATTKTVERVAKQYPQLYAVAKQQGELPDKEREELRAIMTSIFEEKMNKHKIK